MGCWEGVLFLLFLKNSISGNLYADRNNPIEMETLMMPLTGKQETEMSTEVMQCSWQKKEVRTKGKSGGDSQHDRKCRVGHRSKETCKSFLQITFICNVQETTSSAKMKRNEVLEVWGEKYKAVSHSGEWEHVGSRRALLKSMSWI